MKKIFIVLLIIFSSIIFGGCEIVMDTNKYYDDTYTNPLKDIDVGGNDYLSLSEDDTTITMENEQVRIIFSKANGSIKELCNKISKVYLTKNGDSRPLRITKIQGQNEVVETRYNTFKYRTLNDTNELKELELTWYFNDLKVTSIASLKEGSDEVTLRLKYDNNKYVYGNSEITNSLYNIEYPIIEGIDTLYKKENDYFVSSFATGYEFNNPIDNFNTTDYNGISKADGMYPSGWNCSMQLQYLYSKGIGGFLMMTKDGKDTIKSFTCTGQDKTKLRMSIFHYVNDLSLTSAEFNYDICLTNLTEGNWYEGANRYYDWAQNQSWCTDRGLLSTQENVNKTFYEETILCNFNYPYQGRYGKDNQKELYELEKSSLNGGTILNVAFGNNQAYNDSLRNLARDNNDLFLFFQFPDFYPVDDANKNIKMWNSQIKSYKANDSSVYYQLGSTREFYECAGYQEYRNRFYESEKAIYTRNQVSGYYHDVGIAAVHPMQCFNLNHEHGTYVNLITESLEQMKDIKNLAVSQNNGIYGQELIFEQMLPYLDFYQARANGGLLSGMEQDRIMCLLKNNSAKKIPLFDYIYSSYGAKRLDGFLLPDTSIGKGYYYVAEFTVINGGIVEYNYEFFEDIEYISVAECDTDRMNYLGYLYELKKSFNDYLVYGKMEKAPNVNSTQTEYSYRLIRFSPREGEAWLDDIITSAYSYNNNVCVFVANTSTKTKTTNFVLHTLRDYGVSSGKINVLDYQNNVIKQINISSGNANVSLELGPHEICVLEFSK